MIRCCTVVIQSLMSVQRMLTAVTTNVSTRSAAFSANVASATNYIPTDDSAKVSCSLQCESKNPPPWGLVAIFSKRLGIFKPNFKLLADYAFLSTLEYEFLFNYLQLWRSCAILSVTTQFTSCAQNVHHRPKRTLAFFDIFPKRLGIFRQNFTRLLHVHI